MFIESFLIGSITQTTWLFWTKNQASSFFAFGKSRFLCNSCIRISHTKHFLIYIMSDYYNNFRNFTEILCFIFGQKLCMHLKLFGYRSFRISRQLTLLFFFCFFSFYNHFASLYLKQGRNTRFMNCIFARISSERKI